VSLGARNDKGDRLYRRFLDGNVNALAELTELYRESLTQFITGFIGNTSDAEELMLEAFTRVLSNKGNFKWQSSFKTYLFSIGRILALLYLKERKQEDFISVDADIADRDGVSPETDYLDGERKRQLHEAMQKSKTTSKLVVCTGPKRANYRRVLRRIEKSVNRIIITGSR